MTVALSVHWRARAGAEDEVLKVLTAMTPLTQKEPGCIHYYAHQSVDDPLDFFLYEQYVDRDAFDAHCASDYFERYVRGRAIPALESRTVQFYSVITG